MIDSWCSFAALRLILLISSLLITFTNSYGNDQTSEPRYDVNPFSYDPSASYSASNNYIGNYLSGKGEEPLVEYLLPPLDGQPDDFETFTRKHRLSPLSMERHNIRTRHSFMFKNKAYEQEHLLHTRLVDEVTERHNMENEKVVFPQDMLPKHRDDFDHDVFGAEVNENRANALYKLQQMRSSMGEWWDMRSTGAPIAAGDHRHSARDQDMFGLHERYTSDSAKLLNAPVSTYYPTSQPTMQPTRQPFGSPTSRPTESPKVPFKVFIDNLVDGPPPNVVTIGTCPVIHNDLRYLDSDSGTTIDQSTDDVDMSNGNGVCNYRTALKYCIDIPNYDSGLVSECVIVWPRNSYSLISSDGDEIVWDFRVETPDSTLGLISKYPVNIVFDGRGSTIVGDGRRHFITTTPKNDTNFNISTYFNDYDQFFVESEFRRLTELEAIIDEKQRVSNHFEPDTASRRLKEEFDNMMQLRENSAEDESVGDIRNYLYNNAKFDNEDAPIISDVADKDVSVMDTRFDSRFKNPYKIGSNFDLQSGKSGIWAKMMYSTMTFKDIVLKGFGFPASNGGCLKLIGLMGVVLDNAKLYNCSGVLGGGMFIQNTYFVDIINSSITHQRALDGGGAFIYFTKYIRIFNSNISHNYATNVGGGLVIDNTGNLTIANSVFDRNQAFWSMGGALSIINVLGAYNYISKSNFTNNNARYGSAISMAGNKCHNLLCDNYFAFNDAVKSGTVYWLYESGMEVPNIPLTNYSNRNNNSKVCWNSFIGNNIQLHGNDLATEPVNLTTTPRVSLLSNYTSSARAIDIRVDLLDFYDRNVKSPVGTNVMVLKERRDDCVCFYNTDNCLIVDNITNPIHQGRARFSKTKFSCIPSDWELEQERDDRSRFKGPYVAYMDPTFFVGFALEAFDYPRYMKDMNKSIEETRAVKGKARIYFRTCVDGEKYDYFTSTRSTCSVCKNEYLFKFKSNTETRNCLPCPKPVKYCLGKDLILYEGTFRWTNFSTRIYECPLIGGCIGGTVVGSSSCGDRFEGPWCGLCKEGYYQSRQTNTCELCAKNKKYSLEDLFFIALVSFAFIIPFISYVVKKYIQRNSDEDKDIKDIIKICNLNVDMFSSEADLIKDMLSQCETIKKARSASWLSRFKITIVTYQIICQAPQTLQMDFTESMNNLIDAFSAINLDFLRVIPISCYNGYHFLEQMRMMTLLPFAVFTAFFALYLLQIFAVFLSDRNKLSRKQKETELRIGYFGMFLVFIYVILPSLSTLIFQTFDCVEVDPLNESIYRGNVYLRTDFFVDCKSKVYNEGWVYALSMSAVYPGGMPLLFFLLLFICREEIISRMALDKIKKATMIRDSRDPVTKRTKLRLSYKRLSSAIRFLYIAYEPKFWYWDFVEITRRLVLTSFLSIIFAGTVAQVTISIAFSLIYIKVYNYYKPYHLDSEDTLSELCQYQIFITLFGASMFLQRSLGTSDSTYVYLDNFLVLCNLSAVLLNLYYIYIDVVDAIEVNRQMRDKNTIVTAISVGSRQIIIHSKYMTVDENIEEKKRIDALASTQKEPIKLVKEKWKTKFDMTVKEDVKLFMEIVNNMSDDDVFRLQAMIFENIIKYERRCADKIWIYCQDPIIIGTFADVKSGKAKENALVHAMPLRVAQLGVQYEATPEDATNPRVPVPKYVADLIAMDVGFSGELFRPKKEVDKTNMEAKQNLDDSKGADEYDDGKDEFDDEDMGHFKANKGDADGDSDNYYDEHGIEIKRNNDNYHDDQHESDEEDVEEYKSYIAKRREELKKEKNFFDLDNEGDDGKDEPTTAAEIAGKYFGGDNEDAWRGDNDNLFDDLSDDDSEGATEVLVRKGGQANSKSHSAHQGSGDYVANETEDDEIDLYADDSGSIRIKSNKLRRASDVSVGSSVSEFEMGDTSAMKRNLLKKQRMARGGKDVESSDFESDHSVGGFNRPRDSDVEDIGGDTESGASYHGGSGKFNSKLGARGGYDFKRTIIPIVESGSEESSLPRSTKAASLSNANNKRNVGKSDGGSVGARSDRGSNTNGNDGDFDSDFGPRGYVGNLRDEVDDDDDNDKYETTARFLDKNPKSSKAPPVKGQVNNWSVGDSNSNNSNINKNSDSNNKSSKPIPSNNKLLKVSVRNSDEERNFASDYSTEGEIQVLQDYNADDGYDNRFDDDDDNENDIENNDEDDDFNSRNNNNNDENDDDEDEEDYRTASRFNKAYLKNAFESSKDIEISLKASTRKSVVATPAKKNNAPAASSAKGSSTRSSFRK